ncbi:MAG: ExeM/NucH family extracellular endonuclease [Methylophilaceae bacterium]|nr:ExeM/NucH family extracellular endonuclease [Methylophilaceae bacterium]
MATSQGVSASDNGLVISQIYGGGGNTSAPYRNDFIELFNAGSSPISLAGYSVQYASATGTGNFGANAIVALPNVSLQPGKYFLVQQASGGTVGNLLPTSDATGTTNMSGTAGKVILVNSTTSLACNGTSTACSAADLAKIVDLVGFGNANFFEGTVADAPSNILAIFRANNGCADTNNNASDFATAAPAPRNISAASAACGGAVNQPIVASCPALTLDAGTGGAITLTASDADSIVNGYSLLSSPVAGITLNGFASAVSTAQSASLTLNVATSLAVGSYPVTVGFINNQAQSTACIVNVTVQEVAAITHIYDIQGAGQGISSVSPLNGTAVATEGIVTAVFSGLNGFYIQDEVGDGNPLTSDGVFVYGLTTGVAVGDKVRLKANVTEFNTVTELVSPSNLTVLSRNNPVLPLDISLPEVVDGDLENYEGMLVRIITPLTVSQNYFQGRYGQVTLSADGRLKKPSNLFPAASAEAAQLADKNARSRITLDDGSSVQNPNPIPFIGQDNTLRAGDIAQSVTGVVDYGLISASNSGPRDYKINPTITPVFSRDNPRTAAPEAVGGNVKVASFNVLNFFSTFTNGTTASGQTGQGCSLGSSVSASNCRGADNLAEFVRQRDKIVNAIAAINPDVAGLMEMQNNGSVAIQTLVDALNAKVGANTYARIQDPTTGTGADAIKVAMIYKPARLSPVGRSISDADSINNRPPLAQTFSVANGEKFSVIVNHMKSKSCSDSVGADADQNDGQGCYNARRILQATRLADVFVPQVIANAGDNDVLVIGDLNAYGHEDPIELLNSKGLSNQIERFLGNDGYSYVFDGESGYIDYGLANASMATQVSGLTEWHINADEPFVIDYNTEFKPQDLYTPEPYQASDHDPVVVGLNLVKVINSSAGRDTLTGTAGDDVINGGETADTITTGTGRDTFVYQSMREAMDTLIDFIPSLDQINLHTLLANIGYSGSNAFVDGYVSLVAVAEGVSVQIDTDGSQLAATYRPLVLLKGVTLESLNIARDFVL